jgi:hypothetical protein
MPEAPADTRLTAYLVGDPTGWVIEPASPRRRWMDDFNGGFPYRCLPLSIANQCGWVVRSPIGFSATWYGAMTAADTRLRFDECPEHWATMISSHFGGGVVTFSLPWLFRTGPGVCLWVRGLPNVVKPGAQALDGVVETFWSPMTFTMNWQLIDPGRTVRFEKGEGVAFLMPMSVELVESTRPRLSHVDRDPEVSREYREWTESRTQFLARKDRAPEEWQKDYISGRRMDGTPAEGHRTRLKLMPFEREP